MSSLGTVTQQAVLDALANGGPPEKTLQSLKQPFSVIRQAYRSGQPPPFEQVNIRAAYALGYFPHHADLAAAAYGAAGADMLGLRDGACVVVLGAGPGPEVVGLAQFLTQSGKPLNLVFHLVDRQRGWRATRVVTIDAVLKRIKGFDPDQFQIHAHEHDLATQEGLTATGELLCSADLVIVETLLTELPSPAGKAHLVDWLIDRIPAHGRLLVIDLRLVQRHQESQHKLSNAKHLRPRLSSELQFPAATPLPIIAQHFFPSGERPRVKLEASINLYSRPGNVLLPLSKAVPFQLNTDQQAALDKLHDFLKSPTRIFVLSGPAGTGKTALFPAIVSLAQASEMTVKLLAPTGQAARRLAGVSSLGASTVHSTIYCYAGVRQDQKDDPLWEGEEDQHLPVAVFENRAPPEEPAVYVIDEASLIGNHAIDKEDPEVVFAEGTVLTDLLEFALHHPESRVVFVGDAEQLPPVGEQEPPALTSSTLKELTGHLPLEARLSQVMRQDEESGLLDLADQARLATLKTGLNSGPDNPDAGINLLGSTPPPRWINDALVLGQSVVVAARNADVARWNSKIRVTAGRPADHSVHGDRVTVLRRDVQRELLNGDDLVVDEVTDYVEIIRLRDERVSLRKARFHFEMFGLGPIFFDALFVEDLLDLANADEHRRVSQLLFVDFKIRNKHLKPNTPEFDQAYSTDSRVNALRVGYSYARTCHRAQGGEWRDVVVDFSGCRWLGPSFGRWAYTAVTRAKQSVWLANMYLGGGRLGSEYLTQGATNALNTIDLRVIRARPIQHAVQLEITDVGGGPILFVNVFEKKGRPSRAVTTGGARPPFTDQALAALNEWIEEQAIELMEPLPERLKKTVATMGAELQEDGYDLQARPFADYEVEFHLMDSVGRRAEAICSYKSNGRFNQPKRQSGDLLLQKLLREKLESFVT